MTRNAIYFLQERSFLEHRIPERQR